MGEGVLRRLGWFQTHCVVRDLEFRIFQRQLHLVCWDYLKYHTGFKRQTLGFMHARHSVNCTHLQMLFGDR